MKIWLKLTALSAASLSLCACATMTRGAHTAWEVYTTPPGASVKTTNGMSCDSTPCSLRMDRKSEFTATVRKPGYKSVTIEVHHKVGGAGGVGMAGNVLVGGLIGAGVDVATGAMLDLTPNPVHLDLEAEPPVIPATVPLPQLRPTSPSSSGTPTDPTA